MATVASVLLNRRGRSKDRGKIMPDSIQEGMVITTNSPELREKD